MNNEKLIEQAKAARLKAYTPYSNFKVGAALLAKDGKIFHGCNVENASPTACATAPSVPPSSAPSQKATSRAISTSWQSIGETDNPIAPCGACRQVTLELGGNQLPVVLANLKGDVRETTAAELLPEAFGGWDLKK